jgi:hypothetical protein
MAGKWRPGCGQIEQIGSSLSSFEENPEELDGINDQFRVLKGISAGLSQPDEAAFSGVRNRKRGHEIGVVRFPINFCPMQKVQRTLNHAPFQPYTFDCVMGPSDGHFVEIPANPLSWHVV